MTLQELKKEADALSREERTELRKHLTRQALIGDPEWVAEIARRGDEMKAGKYFTEDEVANILAKHDQKAS